METTDKIVEIVRKYTDQEVSKEKNLVDDLFLDSIDRVEMIMDIESEFNISIEEDIFEKLPEWTVDSLITFVKTRVK